MPATQYLQVPKPLHTRKSRSRSRPRHVEIPREVLSPTQVVVSPVKLSFKPPQSPPPPAVSDPTPSPDTTLTVAPVILQTPIFTPAPLKNPAVSILGVPHRDTHMSDSVPAPYNTGHASPPLTPPVMAEANSGTNYDDLMDSPMTLDPTGLEEPTPPTPPPSLRERLIGAWKLESYVAYPTPQSTIQRPTFPMTKNVTGFIMYTPDGYMSATMLIPGQHSFKRGEGEEPQWAEAGKRCFTYCGPYYISNEGPGREEVLRHTFQCCNLPGWIGDIQVRTHHFEEDEDGTVLVLGSEEPTEVKGDKRVPVLKWRRARDNATGVPPPPTPQITVSGPGEIPRPNPKAVDSYRHPHGM